MLFDAQDSPQELREPRFPAAPVRWRCVTPELEFLEWPEFLDAAVPRGGHPP